MTLAQRRGLYAIVVVAFGLRLWWALYARPEAPVRWYLSGDQFSYFHHGVEIAQGHGYLSYITGEATAYYPIGYPAILGALYFVVLHTPIPDNLMLATALFHVVVGTTSVLLVAVIGRAVGGVWVGLLAAGLYAVFPNMIFQVSSVQLETVFVLLLLIALAIGVTHKWAEGAPTARRCLAFGAALGAAVLVRPFAAVLLVGFAGALVAIHVPRRRVVVSLLIPLGAIVALSAPWTVRNTVQLDAFVPSSTNMGDTLCIDRNLDARGGFRFADHDGCVNPALPEVERNAGNTRKAVRFVLDHPDREVLQIARRARIMFAGDHDGLEAVQSLGGGPLLPPSVLDVLRPLADWYFYLLVAVAALGAPILARHGRRSQGLLVLSGLLGLLAIPLLLWGNPRFHLPLAPFFAVSAAAALDAALQARLQPDAASDASGNGVSVVS